MTVLISAVLPIALVVLVGFGLGNCFKLDLQTLAKVNIYGMLPALVISSLASLSLDFRSIVAMVLAYFLNTACLYAIAVLIGKGCSLNENRKKSLIATTVFANVGNMGLPFILFSLGEPGLERAIIFLVLTSFAIATVFPIVLKGEGLKAGLKFTLKLPVLWAMVIGLLLQNITWTLPLALDRAITLLSEGVIPLALVILGIQLANTSVGISRYEWLGTGLRLIVAPLMACGFGKLCGLGGLDFQVFVLQAGMPSAVNSLIWVTELGGDRIQVSRTIVFSTLMSLLSLPLLLRWLGGTASFTG